MSETTKLTPGPELGALSYEVGIILAALPPEAASLLKMGLNYGYRLALLGQADMLAAATKNGPLVHGGVLRSGLIDAAKKGPFQ